MALLSIVNSYCPRVSHEHRIKEVYQVEETKCFLCDPSIKFTFNPVIHCDKLKDVMIQSLKKELRLLFHMVFSNEESIYFLPVELELIVFSFIRDDLFVNYLYKKTYTIDELFLKHTTSCLSCSKTLLAIMDKYACNKHIVPRYRREKYNQY